MKTKQSESSTPEKSAHIPPPPGGGSWRWDDVQRLWVNLDKVPDEATAAPAQPKSAPADIQTTEE